MRIISRKLHAMLDYIWAAVLIAAPWLLGFNQTPVAMYTAVVPGLLIIGLSLITDYEGGVFKYLSMWTHLSTDVILGFFLALTPWIFSFNHVVFLPHLFMGIFAIGAGLTTKAGLSTPKIK